MRLSDPGVFEVSSASGVPLITLVSHPLLILISMARKLRVDAPGYWHHIWHRASAGRLAFRDDIDHKEIWALIRVLREQFGLEVHAVALMSTHMHLVVCSMDGRLSEAMQWMLSVYTKRFNKRHGINGALFQGRFKSDLLLDEAHIARTIRYVHANPLDIGGVDLPEAYRWSSCGAHAGARRSPSWIPRRKVAYILRNDTRLSRSYTKQWASPRARRFPARVPAAVVNAAITRHAAEGQPIIAEAMRSDPRIRGPAPPQQAPVG